MQFLTYWRERESVFVSARYFVAMDNTDAQPLPVELEHWDTTQKLSWILYQSTIPSNSPSADDEDCNVSIDWSVHDAALNLVLKPPELHVRLKPEVQELHCLLSELSKSGREGRPELLCLLIEIDYPKPLRDELSQELQNDGRTDDKPHYYYQLACLENYRYIDGSEMQQTGNLTIQEIEAPYISVVRGEGYPIGTLTKIHIMLSAMPTDASPTLKSLFDRRFDDQNIFYAQELPFSIPTTALAITYAMHAGSLMDVELHIRSCLFEGKHDLTGIGYCHECVIHTDKCDRTDCGIHHSSKDCKPCLPFLSFTQQA